MNNPPPIPGTNEHGSLLDKYAPARKKVYDTVVDQVMDGTRFVTIPFVFSIVILSFKRHIGGVHEVRTGEFPIGGLAKAAVVTALFGWWGFPFGILWSLLTIFYLWRGGRDQTFEILKNAVGPQEAKRILSVAAKPKLPPTIWIVRAIAFAPLCLLAILIVALVSAS